VSFTSALNPWDSNQLRLGAATSCSPFRVHATPIRATTALGDSVARPVSARTSVGVARDAPSSLRKWRSCACQPTARTRSTVGNVDVSRSTCEGGHSKDAFPRRGGITAGTQSRRSESARSSQPSTLYVVPDDGTSDRGSQRRDGHSGDQEQVDDPVASRAATRQDVRRQRRDEHGALTVAPSE
jgi:hypothetical protein